MYPTEKEQYHSMGLSLVHKRLEILYSQRIREGDRVLNAIRIQDELSRKSSPDWDSTDEIRKWREKR